MKQVKDAIEKFFEGAKNPVLFAGAGVAVHAGLPDWKDYLTKISGLVRNDDPSSATLMGKFVAKAEYDRAISILMLSTEIREADKFKFIAAPLKVFDKGSLVSLARLPFRAIVTTNFDLALHDAYATVTSHTPVSFSVDDDSLRAALFTDDFFIARIHGRVEVPTSVVLSHEQLTHVVTRSAYLAFLEHMFTQRDVLFVGFSFFDPAIRAVFEAIEQRLGVIHKGKHVALVPGEATGEFVRRLERFNIKRVNYKMADGHKELWEGIQAANVRQEQVQKVQRPTSSGPLELARKYLASCYARSRLGTSLMPLRRAVTEGIVGQVIHSAGTSGIEVRQVAKTVSGELKVDEKQIGPLIEEALAGLQKEGLVRFGTGENASVVRWVEMASKEDDLDQAISHLVDAAINRYVVRERGHDSPEVRAILRDFFFKIGVQRGWDLGAAFAAKRAVEDLHIDQMMYQCSGHLVVKAIDGLIAACNDLFRHPDSRSAGALVTLGRASFGLELVIQAPRDAVFHAMTLPQSVFLDANILLPAITEGHPYHELYEKSIARLLDAGAQSLGRVQLFVYEGFLNEVVSHRRLAIDDIAKLGLEEARDMARLYGTQSVNVFVGAFANLQLSDPSLTFDGFLARFAPYQTERQLEKWLVSKQISVLRGDAYIGTNTKFGDIYHRLEVIFADSVARGERTGTTVRHDAVQLSILEEDRKKGRRSILVSADRRLREGLRGTPFSQIGNCMVDGLGLSQMIDLLIGNPADEKGLAGLYWSTHVSSSMDLVRSYFLNKALDEYDEAVAMNIGDVVERISEEVSNLAQRQGLDLTVAEGKKAIEGMRLVGTFEDRFYEEMRRIVEKRRNE